MRITSWNVNGLKSMRPLPPLFESLDSDIICLQETKISGPGDPELESVAFVDGYYSFFSICKQKRGYSGVATFCRKKVAVPYDAGEGFCNTVGGSGINRSEYEDTSCPKGNITAEDKDKSTKLFNSETLELVKSEGRCIITDHGGFVLINVYIPALTVIDRAAFKMEFLHALRAKINALQRIGRKVIVAGDFNICPSPRDRAEPVLPTELHEWSRTPSRVWFSAFLDGNNMVDSFRELHLYTDSVYTCWSEATRGRENNHGLRIDLIVISRDLFDSSVTEAAVWSHIKGSDHCPVTILLRQENDMKVCAKCLPSFCTQHMPRFAFRQQSLISLLAKREKQSLQNFTKTKGLASKIGKVPKGQAVLGVRRLSQHEKTGKEFRDYQKRKGRYTQTSFLAFKQATESFKTSNREENRNAIHPNNAEETISGEGEDGRIRVGPRPGSKNEAKENHQERELIQRKATSRAWSKLLTGPPPTPRCRHGETCVVKKVNKSGQNRGRTFFSCPYPAGIGKTASCNFFQWAPF